MSLPSKEIQRHWLRRADSVSLNIHIEMLPRRKLRFKRFSPKSQELPAMSQLMPKTSKRPKQRLSEAFRERSSRMKSAWSTALVHKFHKIKPNEEPWRGPVLFTRWILSLTKMAYYELVVPSSMPTFRGNQTSHHSSEEGACDQSQYCTLSWLGWAPGPQHDSQ